MTAYQKYQLTRGLVVVCLVIAAFGLNNMLTTLSADGFWGAGLLYGGVSSGLVLSVVTVYYRSRSEMQSDPQKFATETLARLNLRKIKNKKGQ